MSKALNYNEQKVKSGKAEMLFASGFLKEADRLTFYDKMRHFERLTSLNERAVTNTLHISLNFDPSEKIESEKMIGIAESYMNQIGFGRQPFLVYRHQDAGHPHIHIVSTNIETTGNRISLHNLGRNQSEKARKAIEIEFGLVKAEDKKNVSSSKLLPLNASKVRYGKTETRQGISNVLAVVLNQYRFISLAEFNAVLKLYNIVADPGQKDSRINKHQGLTYRVLDEQGNKVGVPIKGSAFFMKPTIRLLEKKFAENEPLKQPYKKRITTAIDWTLNKNKMDLQELISALSKENLSVVLRQNKEGLIYGITYVDHKTKCVFNGSDLGKAYSAKGILERCGQSAKNPESVKLIQLLNAPSISNNPEPIPGTNKNMIDVLMQSEQAAGNDPYHFKKTTKKKRRKKMSI